MGISGRIKKIDVEKLDDEALASLDKQMTEKASKIINKAKADINEFLNVYGAEIVIGFSFKPLDEE